MARISTTVRRRVERGVRRRDKILADPTYRGTPRLYRFDASLRIAGIGEQHDAMQLRTGIEPTRVVRKGEPWFAGKRWQEDLWRLDSPLGGVAPLDAHLQWLWQTIAPHQDYFRQLIALSSSAELVLGCFSESPYPYLTVESDSLHLLRELNLGVSFNFTCV
ncbi:DUF4279 domain-containing protein [Acidovorax sp. A1169]|uniref:DUF4279 domain-containing protein n=1 Tax=Acidovorax sp. A1169 TaxID=3059524 RepID=UPI002737B50A|nr:DUF4279 domain-containing protein [Acidovorax sp. A1169]MDP4073714.1 DUF4279 domain-containing protein [Acidovorax sp. A1169]